MNANKRGLWIASLVAVLVIGGIGYGWYQKDHSVPTGQAGQKVTPNPLANAKQLQLSTFNEKEKQLTDDAEKIYKQINDKYDQLQKGTLSDKDFVTAMAPLQDQMKKNWDDYKAYTESNAISDTDRNSVKFKEGVQLASGLRLDAYTFLLNVVTYHQNKQQITDNYKKNLTDFEAKLNTYRSKTA